MNSRDNNFTPGKIQRPLKHIEESVARCMSQLCTADSQLLQEKNRRKRCG
ncbi:hypothetical protein IVB44_21420 [Bradyrhizobium sp. 49]|nr:MULTISPECIES: hypothetical protein [unclassified Bradyrhizobium]MCK1266753.1 hypothetical protein [Bradyrhizobium sp. 84]MCK1373528.1 hypothetical protein [Bradyrhizobium sp. 49]